MGKPDLTPTGFSAESGLPPQGGQSSDGVLFRLAVALAFAVLSICYIKGVSGTVAVLAFVGIIVTVPTAALIMLAVATRSDGLPRP